jgi:hypothetical protein
MEKISLFGQRFVVFTDTSWEDRLEQVGFPSIGHVHSVHLQE